MKRTQARGRCLPDGSSGELLRIKVRIFDSLDKRAASAVVAVCQAKARLLGQEFWHAVSLIGYEKHLERERLVASTVVRSCHWGSFDFPLIRTCPGNDGPVIDPAGLRLAAYIQRAASDRGSPSLTP